MGHDGLVVFVQICDQKCFIVFTISLQSNFEDHSIWLSQPPWHQNDKSGKMKGVTGGNRNENISLKIIKDMSK